MLLTCTDKKLDLAQPQVMGILNVTPDSRYGSEYFRKLDLALDRAEEMVKEGAAIIDIGGESTRPGAEPISLQEELDRVIPLIEALTKRISVIVSIDTRKSSVMHAAMNAGVHFINDVNALQDEGALELVAKSKVAVCLMHMQGEPQTMQQTPSYVKVVEEVKMFLNQRLQACLVAGIPKERIVVDPGFGFGKNLQHNLQLLKNFEEFKELEIPLLVGLSRKSMIEQLLNLPVEERLYPSLALAVIAVSKGANIIRTHDVRPTVEAIKIAAAVLSP